MGGEPPPARARVDDLPPRAMVRHVSNDNLLHPLQPVRTPRQTASINSPFAFTSAGSLEGSVRETATRRTGSDDDGNKTVNQYSVIGDLGKGAYSKVKLVIDNDNDEVRAMKIMKKSILKKKRSSAGSSAMDNVLRELALLKKIQHRNIVQLYEVIDDAEDDKLFMVLEYLEKGPLLKLEDS
eukprot:gene22706-34773_t